MAIGASAMAEVTLLTSSGSHDHRVPLFLFLVTLFTYNYHRLFRGRGVRVETYTDRHRWISRHRKPLVLLVVVSGVGAALLAFRLSAASLVVLAPFGAIALFYSVLPFATSHTGIRDVPFAKVFLVALTWAGATAAFPLVEGPGSSPDLAVVVGECAERFFFILALTIPFDIRDLPHDDPGKRTIPQVVGIDGARAAALLALAAFAALALLGPDHSAGERLALFGSAILSGLLVAGVRAGRSELYYTGWIESMMLVQLLLVRMAL